MRWKKQRGTEGLVREGREADAACKRDPGRAHRGDWKPRGPGSAEQTCCPLWTASSTLCVCSHGWERKRPGTARARNTRRSRARRSHPGRPTFLDPGFQEAAGIRHGRLPPFTTAPWVQEAAQCRTPMNLMMAFLGGARVISLDIHMDIKMHPQFQKC